MATGGRIFRGQEQPESPRATLREVMTNRNPRNNRSRGYQLGSPGRAVMKPEKRISTVTNDDSFSYYTMVIQIIFRVTINVRRVGLLNETKMVGSHGTDSLHTLPQLLRLVQQFADVALCTIRRHLLTVLTNAPLISISIGVNLRDSSLWPNIDHKRWGASEPHNG